MSSKINIAYVKNPIYPNDILYKQVSYVPGKPVSHYIKDITIADENELHIRYGGRELSTEECYSVIPKPGEYMVILPKVAGGGENRDQKILSTVLTIILMMYTGPVGNAATVATGGATAAQVAAQGMAAWNFWGYAAAIGFQVAGGMLLNHMFPPAKPELEQQSQTYTWNGIQPLVGQGNPVPIILGRMKVAGLQPIASHVISDGDKQYLNLLIEAGEGPCDYVGNGEDADCIGIDNIKINGNPLENYTGITVYKRAGLNDQSPIPNFEDTRLEQQINVELKNDSEWHMFTTTGDAGSGLEVTFTMAGLFGVSSKGSKYANEIRVEIEYKPTGTDDWIKHQSRDRIGARRVNDSEYGYAAYIDGDYRHLFSIGQQVWLVQSGQLYPAIVQAVKLVNIPDNNGLEYHQETRIKFNISPTSGLSEIEYVTNYISIEGKYLSQYSKTISINTGTTGRYDVRCRCIYKLAYGDNDAHRIIWAKLAHIIYDDFIYPNKTLLSIQALAYDQISGSVNVTFELTRSYVWVWVPDYPNIDPWGPGSYQLKPATNPAWALYWLYHRVYRLFNVNTHEWEFVVRGVPANRMIYQEFSDWAKFCDERGIEVNIYIDTVQKLRDAAEAIERLARGRVRFFGTKIGCVFDGPAKKDANGMIIPAQVFNVANINIDSFSEQWVNISERAKGIVVTYWDRDNDYERTPMLVPADGLTEGQASENPTEVTLIGCTSREVAWKWAKYQLRINNYINNTITKTSDVNAIVSSLGQTVFVQHDVPRWGYGGLVKAATTTQVELDTPVIMEAGKVYTALFWLNNDTYIEKAIVTQPGETTIITVQDPFIEDTVEANYLDHKHFWVEGDKTEVFTAEKFLHIFLTDGDQFDTVIGSVYDPDTDRTIVDIKNCPENIEQVRYDWTMPHEFDNWLFGPVELGIHKHSRPFKIIGFTRDENLKFRIVAINYEDMVYTEAEDVPEIDYSLSSLIFEVENLSLREETFGQEDGTLISRLHCSWNYPIGQVADQCKVFYSDDNGISWKPHIQGNISSTIIENVQTGVTYLVKVMVAKGMMVSQGVVKQITIKGKDWPPGDVKSLIVVQQENILKVSVIPPDDPDINRFELRVGGLSWETSYYLKQFKDVQTTLDVTQAGTQIFWAKAIDNSGNYSDNAASFIAAIYPISNKFTIYEEYQNGRSWTPKCMFWDRSGWQIDSVEKLGDLEVIAQMFDIDIHLCDDAEVVLDVVDLGETIIPTNYVETFLSVFAEYDASDKNYIDVDYRTSWDNVNWSDWQPLVNHQFNGRFVQPKLKPRSVDGRTNVHIRGVTVRIDVTAVTETIDFVDVADTGVTRIYLNHRFFNTPMPQLFSYDNTGKQCAHEIVGNAIQKDDDGRWYFDVRLWDLTGTTQIAGRIGGSAKGY